MTTDLLQCDDTMSANPVRCVFFHPSELTRCGWALQIQQYYPTVSILLAASLEEMRQLLSDDEPPPLVVMEFHPYYVENGTSILHEMVALVGADNIVLVCGSPAYVTARTAMQSGISVLIGYNDSIHELINALLSASASIPFMSSELASLLVQAVPPSDSTLLMPSSSSTQALSTREVEVVNMLIAGLSPNHVATGLGVSVKTVSTHKRNALGKLGVKSILAVARVWS